MMQKNVNIGIVGLGRLGKRHADNLHHRIPNARLIAAASPVEQERAYAAGLGITHICSSLDELLQVPGLDAVVLVTPTALHAEQSIAVLQAGKHLFVEKPLALNVADCERVEAAYAQSKSQHPQQIAMVGFVRRFDPSYAAAKAAIENGEIGSPFYIRSQTCDKLDPSGFFIRFSADSGGIIMDCNIHDIDLARWLLADKQGRAPQARKVYASGTCAVHPELAAYQDVDNAVATIEFDGGRLATIYASRTFAHGHETSTEIIADRGKLLIGSGAARDRVLKSDANGVSHRAVEDFFARFEAAFALELEAFNNACLGMIPAPLSLHDATEATRIGVALTKALRSGEVQTLSPAD